MAPNYQTNLKRRRLGFVMAAVLLVFAFTAAGPVSTALAQDPIVGFTGPDPDNAFSFNIEGCRLEKATEGTYDPTATVPVLYCDTSVPDWPATDDSYTNGNLGKEWNELDLVPHRFGSNSSGLAADSQKFQVILGADNLVDTSPLAIGYDRIANVVFRDDLSTGTASDCQLTLIGANQIGDFGIGGAIEQIVQVVEITQTKDTTCVWDYVQQLAITASNISGSSNRSYIVAGTGAQSVPLPSDIQPQALAKSMSAVEDSLINWTIQKVASPIDWNFGNTCNQDVPNTKDVTVDITFTKGATELGDLTATTTVDATNPSSRTVFYDCTDNVFSGDTLVDSAEPEPFAVPPSEMVMFDIEHILNPGTRDLRDELTCTLQVEDILVPGTFIDVGTLTAEFSLPNEDIAPGEVVNETVVVDDTESITDGAARYDFSAVHSGGVSGGFIGYTPGTATDGPVVWKSDAQGDSGTVQFTKTVTVERGYDINGKLEDTASIDLTDITDVSATAATTFTTDPKIDLGINKNLGFTVANDTVWKFEVKDSGDNVEANKEITIPAGSSSGSVTVYDLDPDTYTVTETVLDGWVPAANPQNVTLSLPSCEGSVTFTNEPSEDFFAQVEVKKMTDPTGKEAGWIFDLSSDNSDNGAQVTTTDANFIRFDLDGGTNKGADAGSYSVAEQEKTGWDLQEDITFAKVGCKDASQNVAPETRASCDFVVQYERDAGCVFQCTYKNIERGKIIVEKQTDPADSPKEFQFTGEAAGFLSDNGKIEVDNLEPGTYYSTEFVPVGWDLTDITCDDGASSKPSSGNLATATATFELDPGETVTCVFTNTERGMVDVLKTVQGALPGGEVFYFEIRKGADASNVGEVIAEAYHFEADTVIGRTQVEGTDPVSGAADFRCVSNDYTKCANFIVDDYETSPTPTLDDEVQAKLPPGQYQFCEANVMPGWMSDIRDWTNAFPLPGVNGAFFVPNQNDPLVDNSLYCAPFEVAAGDSMSFAVDNTPPPGGDARTIGFWKNWTSCDGHGNQDPVLDETLAKSPVTCEGGGPGIWIGTVCVDTCYEAVSLLDKREISEDLKGKKRASDACYNAASQLLASELNELAGARTCTDLVDLQTETQEILFDEGFDGTGKCVKGGKTGKALNDYAGDLDDYNNNEPGAVCN